MSNDTPEHLDPDEVTCPRCGAAPGDVCRKPTGDRAPTIHAARRREATRDPANPTKHQRGTRRGGSKTGGGSDASRFDTDRARKAQQKAAQSRRRRRAELDAQRERAREQAEADAIREEAERLAADAARYARDRERLRRKVLDTAIDAYDTAHKAIGGVQRVELDDEGRAVQVPVEYDTPGGDRRVKLVPDVRGAYTADNALKLVQAAGLALDKLRLEEGQPTGHTHHTGGAPTESVADQLGREGVAELIGFASTFLNDDEQ